MKRALISMFSLLLLTFATNAAVVINLNVGQLLQSDGTTPVADGALIQILANTNGTGNPNFDAPTATSFTGTSGNDVIVASFGLDSSTGGASGDFQESLATNPSGAQIKLDLTGVSTGDDLLLRWFPTLTTSSSQPGSRTSYGQFRTDLMLNGSDISWSVPPDSATPYTLTFLTVSQGGSWSNSFGIAGLTVVPEPSTFALFGIFGLGLLGFLYRRGCVMAE